MNRQLLQVIDQIERERGISREIIIEAVEAAVVSASRRRLGITENLEANLNRDTGEIEVYALKTVVTEVENSQTEISLEEACELVGPQGSGQDIEIGDQIEIRKELDGLGRIAAQTAKQVILQRVREAERDLIFAKYKAREGELINGVVARVERGNVYVDLGRCEALLPFRELGPRDHFQRGDRIRAYILDVRHTSQGHQIILSRTHPGLLRRLFELEVPEVYEGLVEVLAAVREPGGRGKIAVVSHDPNVDPVGACVGMKGSRVQAVVRELRGENIDIIPFSEDAREFIANALSPAQIVRIVLHEDERRAEVVVDESHLSQAIGKRGQNVRLAAKLTGWQIDIRTDEDGGAAPQPAAEDIAPEAAAPQQAAAAQLELSALADLDDEHRTTLTERGFHSLYDLVAAGASEVEDRTGLDAATAARIVEQAAALVDQETQQSDSSGEPPQTGGDVQIDGQVKLL